MLTRTTSPTSTTSTSHSKPAPQGQRMPARHLQRPLVAQTIADTLRMVERKLPLSRRVLHAGDAVYRAGDAMRSLYLVNSGIFKTISLAADGREQVVSLHFKGDWLGFDGIADAQHACDVVAMDVGEVWCVGYAALMQACAEDLSLMALLNGAMSRQLGFSRDSLLSVCTLPADARVAEFLRYWADRGLRNDQISLPMTRAEIGNHLGMKLETVSRALSRLAREGLISFATLGRRDLQIQDVAALAAFVQRAINPLAAAVALH
jgi:CRP/FNR family transcriptional regulator, anaerobic regulatory protein